MIKEFIISFADSLFYHKIKHFQGHYDYCLHTKKNYERIPSDWIRRIILGLEE